MSARKNDDLRVLEMYAAIQEMKERLDKVGLTYETFINPTNIVEETLVDGMYTSVARITEEAWKISFEVKSRYPNIPWDDVAGMRHHLVHDYPGVLSEYVWNAMQEDMKALENVAVDYCEVRGLELPDTYSSEAE